MIKLIAGLGNPGTKYANTRHNVGFRAIERLLEFSPAKSERLLHHALLFETEKFGFLCKPLTYMNHSGKAVSALSRELAVQPQEILVLQDDFALALGLIRVRTQGSAGGHNGLQSIIDHLGTTRIPRVRLGIKTDEMENWVDFVLSRFHASEKPAVAEMIDLCCDAVEEILKNGISSAMNRFNKKQKLDDGQQSG